MKPRDTRTWKTTVMTTGVPAGSYMLVAEYLSYAYMIEEVAKLPNVNGLMARGHVVAKPVPIRIR